MKFRFGFVFIITTLLSACNFTLAEDVTPPPDYVSPTPVPALVLIPPHTPNVSNGAAIYVEKCLPCHGETGLGDGAQGLQLGVTVKAFGLPEIARPASPAQYYTTVTRGNIERLMPPFNSLNDQERWDVVAYVLTLHTTPEQVAKGKELFETYCADCSTDFFRDQEQMSQFSDVELARLIREGNTDVPPFGADFSEDDLWAATAYLRTLSFDTAPLAQPTTVPVAQTPIAAVANTPSAEGTPNGTEQASAGSEATEGFGTVTGTIDTSGSALPPDLNVTLHGFEHGTSGADEVLTQDGSVNEDGTYSFENVEMPPGRIFIVEAIYGGITLQSKMGVVENGQTTLTLEPIALYEITEESSGLVIDEVNIFFHPADEMKYDVLALYNFRNTGETVVSVKMAERQEIPFLKFPVDSEHLGYEAVQDSAPFMSMDDGFAMQPNEKPYGIVAFSSVTRQEETAVAQEFVLPVEVVRIFVPDGLEVTGDNIAYEGPQDIQGTVYQSYLVNKIQAGETLAFMLSGEPSTTTEENSTTSAASSNNRVLLIAGGIGILLILAGVFMYVRDRKRTEAELEEDEVEEEDEFESSEEVLDAIIALDDLYRAKKISDEAYQKRRAELKEIANGLL